MKSWKNLLKNGLKYSLKLRIVAGSAFRDKAEPGWVSNPHGSGHWYSETFCASLTH
jgi:hypothetical protein